MRNDYLWEGSGEPDPAVQRLERLLGRLRSDRPAPALPEHFGRFARFRARSPWLVPVAAAFALMVAGAWIVTRGVASGWEVARVEGTPRVGVDRIERNGRLEVGEVLETDSRARAQLSVGRIGLVDIEPNSRVRLLKSRLTEQRIALERGMIHAVIWAPPRFFYVDTPSAVAVDLGCAYTLEVDDSGAGLVHVTSGWVSFEREGRESFIPAGAECRTRPGTGPGTPYQGDASAAFASALVQFDFENGGVPALDVVLAEARKPDAFTLWHLLKRSPVKERRRVYDRLAAFVPPPRGVTPEGILRADQGMLERWWDELGLGDTTWWRLWQRQWPQLQSRGGRG